MKELKIVNQEVITKFQTSDGEVYDRKDVAELYEQLLVIEEKVNKLKYVNGAYYCKTQEDFDSIVDAKAYGNPYYDFNSNSYKPRYEYSKSSFKGADWYFFKWEYQDNAADYYWIETLSEKKTEWEEFYRQFKI